PRPSFRSRRPRRSSMRHSASTSACATSAMRESRGKPKAKGRGRELPTPGPILAPRRAPSPESVVRELIERTPGVASPQPLEEPRRIISLEGPVRILFMDLDGTLTNGVITFDTVGDQRHFAIRDGLALQWAAGLGILPIVISGRGSKAAELRMKDL